MNSSVELQVSSHEDIEKIVDMGYMEVYNNDAW